MQFKNILAVALVAVAAVSCDYQKQNKIEQVDLREGDKVVYGVHPDSAAAQTKNVYPSKPEYNERTQKIREKMFNTKGDGSN
jgi:hypothetical protein